MAPSPALPPHSNFFCPVYFEPGKLYARWMRCYGCSQNTTDPEDTLAHKNETSRENNRRHIHRMKCKLSTLCLILALGGLVQAQNAKPDPTGTWKQTKPASPRTFTFKLQGQVLTGTMLRGNNQVAITNGVVKGDQVSFQTRNEASSPKGTFVTTTYTGTLSGDTITGTVATKTDAIDYGSTPWETKREAAKPKGGAAK